MDYTYRMGNRIYDGTIKIRTKGCPMEMYIEADGCSFHTIVGKQENGYFICIPHWGIGSELASLNDWFWNQERLNSCTALGDVFSNAIASALVEVERQLREDWMRGTA